MTITSVARDTPRLPAGHHERLSAGRAVRAELPRRALAELSHGTRDPLGIIEAQNSTRLQDLVPIRTQRMSESPFAFYRGTAAIMAADLANEPHSGILVPSCGDAHVANFGFYASPQRTLLFDLNDFDEAGWAPWEWDLKRLVASLVIAGQATERDERVVRRSVVTAVKSYAFAMRIASTAPPLQRYYTHFEAAAGTGRMDPESRRVLDRAIKHARKNTEQRAARKLTQMDETGTLRFIPRPPTTVPLDPELRSLQQELVDRYLRTVTTDINLQMQHYTAVDSIRRVVGVGSVGTRCTLTLFQDGDENAFILQSKEAGPSVLEQYGGIEQPATLTRLTEEQGHGGRVVAMQRILQAVSDPFLGSLQYSGEDFGAFDLYVRQFRDMKGGIDVETVDDAPFVTYAQACGVTLARAHAQAPNAAEVSGYLGRGGRAGAALYEWALAYAQQSLADYEAFIAAQ